MDIKWLDKSHRSPVSCKEISREQVANRSRSQCKQGFKHLWFECQNQGFTFSIYQFVKKPTGFLVKVFITLEETHYNYYPCLNLHFLFINNLTFLTSIVSLCFCISERFSRTTGVSHKEPMVLFFTFTQDLLDAIHRRNFRVANEVLQKVSRYRYRGALLFEIRRLFKIRKQLILLNSFRKYIPSLRDAAKELVHMPHPPPEVHITIAALFLLLDEPEKNLEVSLI